MCVCVCGAREALDLVVDGLQEVIPVIQIFEDGRQPFSFIGLLLHPRASCQLNGRGSDQGHSPAPLWLACHQLLQLG